LGQGTVDSILGMICFQIQEFCIYFLTLHNGAFTSLISLSGLRMIQNFWGSSLCLALEVVYTLWELYSWTKYPSDCTDAEV